MLVGDCIDGDIRVEIFDHIDDVSEYFKSICINGSDIFLSREWLTFSEGLNGEGRAYYLVFKSDDGATNNLLPLELVKHSGRLNILGYIGGKQSDYHGVIGSSNNELLGSCQGALRQAVSVLSKLHKLDLFAMKSIPVFGNEISQAVWEEYYRSLKKKFRTDIRRCFNQLDKLGVVEYRDNYRSGNDNIINEFIMSNKRTNQGAGLTLEQGFVSEMLKRCSLVKVPVLMLDNEIIAAAICLQKDNAIYYQAPTYDGNYCRYSPGRALLYSIIQSSFSNGISEVDLGPGDERYKLRFANKKIELCNIVYGVSVFGKLALSAKAIKDKMQGAVLK